MLKAMIPTERGAVWVSLGGSLLLAVACIGLHAWAAEPANGKGKGSLPEAEVSCTRLEKGQVFLAPYLVREDVGEGARQLLVLDGAAVAKRILLENREVFWATDARFALVKHEKDQKFRVEIFNAKGESESAHAFASPEGDWEAVLVIGEKVVAHRPNIGGIGDLPYEIVIFSPNGSSLLLKEPDRSLSAITPCGEDAMLVSCADRKSMKRLTEVVDMQGKVRWSRAYPPEEGGGATPSPDGKWVVVQARKGGHGAPTNELVELASQKSILLPRGTLFDTLFLVEQPFVILLLGDRQLTCVGLDGTTSWTQALRFEAFAATLVHWGGQPVVACLGLNSEGGPYELRLFALPDGAPLGAIPLLQDKVEADRLGRGKPTFQEAVPGRLIIQLVDVRFVVDLDKGE